MPHTVPTLLVVDDEDVNRGLLARLFDSRGFRVDTASTGAEALARVNSARPDLVLLDMNMPGMSGFDVLRQIRATYTPGALPVVMVTGVGETRDHVEALELGANDYVTKPIDFPVVLARLKTQLARQQAERALKESEERYALAVRGANDGIWDWKFDTNEGYFSPRWRSVLGYDEHATLTSLNVWYDRVHPNDLGPLRAALEEHLIGSTTHFEYEHRVQSSPDVYRWVLARAVAVRDANGAAIRVAGSITDITEGKVADALTGLPNRVLLMDRLGRLLEHAKRHPDFQVVVIFLDLDRFKVINDSLGHHAGDRLLAEVSGRLRECVRPADTVARLGGDEFAVLLEDIEGVSEATQVAERIAAALDKAFVCEEREVFVTTSVGIAFSHAGLASPEELVRDADIAMYHAKSKGKARYEIFDGRAQASAIDRLDLEIDLRAAMGKQEFRLHYQPVVDLASGRIVEIEALIRWEHRERGLLPPSDFITLSEETGLIVPIGMWVLEEACRQVHAWQSAYESDPPLVLSVNLSARQFQQPSLVPDIAWLLQQTGLRPDCLKLEITESVVMHDAPATLARLYALKDLGVQLAIDDFGTGYSSLSYLKRFPIDVLKIDQGFVRGLGGDADDTAIVRAIITVAKNLNLSVTAEGIETAEQVSLLRELGCDRGQGYYFARPLAADPLAALFAHNLPEPGARPVHALARIERPASSRNGRAAEAGAKTAPRRPTDPNQFSRLTN